MDATVIASERIHASDIPEVVMVIYGDGDGRHFESFIFLEAYTGFVLVTHE